MTVVAIRVESRNLHYFTDPHSALTLSVISINTHPPAAGPEAEVVLDLLDHLTPEQFRNALWMFHGVSILAMKEKDHV